MTATDPYAREAALQVVQGALRWVGGSEGGDTDLAGFEAALGLDAISGTQAGLVADMDRAADALYGR